MSLTWLELVRRITISPSLLSQMECKTDLFLCIAYQACLQENKSLLDDLKQYWSETVPCTNFLCFPFNEMFISWCIAWITTNTYEQSIDHYLCKIYDRLTSTKFSEQEITFVKKTCESHFPVRCLSVL